MNYVVFGASGHTGKIVADSLLTQNKSVRVVVRDSKKGEPFRARGAEVAVADLNDPKATAAALRGAKGVYLLIPPTMTAPSFRDYQDRMIETLSDALRDSKVEHAVFLSSIGAQHATGTGPIAGLHRAEQAFAALSSTAFTHIRAAYFIENTGGSLGMLDNGVFPSFMPADFAFDMIATRDIGRLAAAELVEGGKKTQIIELGGPKHSMNDIASALSRILGKPIRVEVSPTSAVAPAFMSFGFPKDLAEMYQEMVEGIVRGHVAFEGGHRRVQGTTTPEEVLRGMLGK